MTWTPKEGMILKHRTIDQTVYLRELRQTPAGPFWAIDVTRYGPPKPWLIGEGCLVAQYEPKDQP